MKNQLKRICVYCGSSSGNQKIYTETAQALGSLLARHNIDLVYGGASIGIMGVVADSVLSLGGKVIGVIPQSIAKKEVAHQGLTKLIVVESMHERKMKMAELSDGFIALPGGLGTFEEIFEIMTWAQLGFHNHPCGLMNVDHYFDHLTRFLDHATNEGFIKSQHRDVLMVETSPEKLLEQFKNYRPTFTSKLISP